MKDFSARLKHFRSEKKLTQTELGRLAKVSQKQISDYEMGLSIPRTETLNRLIAALGVSKARFLSANIIPDWGVSDSSRTTIINAEKKLSASLSKDDLRRIGSLPSNLYLTSVMGDGFEPFISFGDLILIDKSKTAIQDGSIYLLSYKNQHESLYKVYRQLDGSLRFVKDSSEYADMILKPEELEFEIIGKVVFRQGFL